MNQILYTGKKQKGPTEIKTIVMFFCVTIILFGAILTGQGVYAIYKDKNEKTDTKQEDFMVSIDKEGNSISVKVTSQKVINKIVYNWNNTEDIVLLGRGRTQMEEKIALPTGNNVLNLRVIDVTGKEKLYQKEYAVSDEDLTNPEIELAVVGNNVKIVARDNEKLSYITYRWNEEEEQRLDARQESPKEIETEIPIKKGINKLVVIAVDANNNTLNKEQDIEGVTAPKVSLTQEDGFLVIRAEDEDDGMDRIELTINGEAYNIVLQEGTESPVIEYKQPLKEGDNPFEMKVYNKRGDVTVQKGTCPKAS